jgi:hypothetical protein
MAAKAKVNRSDVIRKILSDIDIYRGRDRAVGVARVIPGN